MDIGRAISEPDRNTRIAMFQQLSSEAFTECYALKVRARELEGIQNYIDHHLAMTLAHEVVPGKVIFFFDKQFNLKECIIKEKYIINHKGCAYINIARKSLLVGVDAFPDRAMAIKSIIPKLKAMIASFQMSTSKAHKTKAVTLSKLLSVYQEE